MKHLALKRVSAVAVTVVLLLTTVFSLSVFANAATFTPRLSAPASTNKYYYNSDYNVFQKYGYGLPNCTAYAYGRAYEILGKEPKLSWNGAGQWYDYNRSNGYYKYGSTPKVGAIACWCYSGGGHVAVIEKIDSNGNMTLSNSEWGGRTFYLTYANKNDSNPGGNSWWTFQGYIYLIDSADVVEPAPVSYKTGIYKVVVDSTRNMRSGAGTSYGYVTSVSNGAKLTVTKVQSAGGYTWGYTTYNKKSGWVALDYCTYVSALPAETTDATTQPTTAKPTTQPTTVAPTTAQPETEPETLRISPEPEQPVTNATTAQPTTQPTTAAPTTQPTTVAPTTQPTTAAPTTQPATVAKKQGLGTGDINSDGQINVVDATIIQRVLSGFTKLSAEQTRWCDFNFDGSITIDDVTGIQKYISRTF